MTDIIKIKAALKSLNDDVNNNKIANATLANNLKVIFKDLFDSSNANYIDKLDPAALEAVIKSKNIHAGFLTVAANPAAVAQMYDSMGSLVPDPVDPNTLPANLDPAAILAKAAAGDWGGIWGMLCTPDGKLDPLKITGAVALFSKMSGSSGFDIAKHGGIATLAVAAINWFNSPDGQASINKLTGGVNGGFGGLLSGGAAGISDFLGNAGGALGDLFKGEQMQHILSTAKENPLAAIALVVAAGMAFNSGKGIFGSLFEFGKLALIMLAVTWVAETYLGKGGQGSRIDHGPVDPTALPPVPAEQLQLAPRD